MFTSITSKIVAQTVFIPAMLFTFSVGVSFAMVQQMYRQSANDPQVQIVEDLVFSYNEGQTPPTADQVTQSTVDISRTLSEFVMLFDKDGKVVISTGALGADVPQLPAGVLEDVKANGESRITWEPQTDVRVATVIDHYQSGDNEGYVLAGRSLKEVEARTQEALVFAFSAWLLGIGGLFASYILFRNVLVKPLQSEDKN
ncbi:hypothetical protein CO180_00190 [candidate division WWE3 bacterium CG_4_9_14_3_um_filter_41_6]|uniref:Single cache domain-containing protein n=1 Tax=candidate division WWE3 bacterium CG_4_10_14_0_2_um_filter_41_14 TaxID=1975072 RepID=A0A2M7THM0_UNCKA|nr:MAG: hypothetical protein COY32_04610 [candidate division WWE3 bacterium CG_4_10_14_0_2_um_filter_41_14]PJA39652.1 MAG: hypothetical protein CO180_00190 [candidate division WWE3 bacterium CG_4_9_14_3_um_filter_41_6]